LVLPKGEGVATLALGSQPRQRLARLQAKRGSAGVKERKCEGMNPHIPKGVGVS